MDKSMDKKDGDEDKDKVETDTRTRPDKISIGARHSKKGKGPKTTNKQKDTIFDNSRKTKKEYISFITKYLTFPRSWVRTYLFPLRETTRQGQGKQNDPKARQGGTG